MAINTVIAILADSLALSRSAAAGNDDDVDYDVIRRLKHFLAGLTPRVELTAPTILHSGQMVLLMDKGWRAVERRRLRTLFKSAVHVVRFSLFGFAPSAELRVPRLNTPTMITMSTPLIRRNNAVGLLRRPKLAPKATLSSSSSSATSAYAHAHAHAQPRRRFPQMVSKLPSRGARMSRLRGAKPSRPPVVAEVIQEEPPSDESDTEPVVDAVESTAMSVIVPVHSSSAHAHELLSKLRPGRMAIRRPGMLYGEVVTLEVLPKNADAPRPFTNDHGRLMGAGSHVRRCRVVVGGKLSGGESLHVPVLVRANHVFFALLKSLKAWISKPRCSRQSRWCLCCRRKAVAEPLSDAEMWVPCVCVCVCVVCVLEPMAYHRACVFPPSEQLFRGNLKERRSTSSRFDELLRDVRLFLAHRQRSSTEHATKAMYADVEVGVPWVLT